MSKNKPIQVEYKTLVVLWFALLSSQILFLVLVYFLKPELFIFDPFFMKEVSKDAEATAWV